MTSEPTLSDVHADLVNRLEQDKRLRSVEQQQAATNSEVAGLRDDIHRLETSAFNGFSELKQLISDSKPKYWPATAAIVAAVGLVLVIAQAIYGQ